MSNGQQPFYALIIPQAGPGQPPPGGGQPGYPTHPWMPPWGPAHPISPGGPPPQVGWPTFPSNPIAQPPWGWGQRPPGTWGGRPPNYVDIGGPGPQPGGPVYPDQSLPGPQPYPDQGLPGPQPYPDQSLPWPQPHPSHPIVIPPGDLPPEPVGPDKMVIVVWVPGYGYKLAVVPRPPGYNPPTGPSTEHPEPQKK